MGLGLVGTGRVRSWVMNYVYGSPHKERSIRMCVHALWLLLWHEHTHKHTHTICTRRFVSWHFQGCQISGDPAPCSARMDQWSAWAANLATVIRRHTYAPTKYNAAIKSRRSIWLWLNETLCKTWYRPAVVMQPSAVMASDIKGKVRKINSESQVKQPSGQSDCVSHIYFFHALVF